MTDRIERSNIRTEKQIDNEIIKISKKNPTRIITAYARLGKVTFYLYGNQPRIDSADTIQTFKAYGGFYKNGKVIKPTKTWFNRHNFIPVSR